MRILLLTAMLFVAIMVSAAPIEPAAKPLPGGWLLRTGVLPVDPTASVTAQGVFTLASGGGGYYAPRGPVVAGSRAQVTSGFIYRAFTGDFIITVRRVSHDKGTAHGNANSGVLAMGNLIGMDTPVAVAGTGSGGPIPWYRIVRRGDRIGIYEGPDGQQWMASNRGAIIAGTVYAGMYTDAWGGDGATTAVFDNVTVNEKPVFSYTTTWLANDFEGPDVNTTNSSLIGLGVAPDGTCVTTEDQGEQEICLARYRDGKCLIVRNEIGGTGNAITLLPNGRGYVGKSNRIVSFDWKTSMQRYAQSEPLGADRGSDSIRGVTVGGNEIFVAYRPENKIVVLDLDSLKVKRSIPFSYPGPLAMDSKGVLWAVEEGWTSGHPFGYPYQQPFRLLGIDPQTGKTLKTITGIELPSALAVDERSPSGARLLVADNGRDQQVKLFDVGGEQPAPMGVLGAKNGVFAGTPGEMRPGKFNGISGLGVDADGNIYTTSNGYPYRVTIPHAMPNLSELKSFAPTAINQPDPPARWALNCPGFNIMGASYDAKTGDVYVGALTRYGYDAKRGLGREWQLAGTTANLRDTWDGESFFRTFSAGPDIRWIDGQRFLFLDGAARVYRLDENGNLGTMVRVSVGDGRILQNRDKDLKAGAADRNSFEAINARFLENAPSPTLDKNGWNTNWVHWNWQDGRGAPRDGRMQREEYEDQSEVFGNFERDSSWIDAKGNIWWCNPDKKSIWVERCTGVKDDVPQYAAPQTYAIPAPFTWVSFVDYDPARDVMVLVGSTSEQPAWVSQSDTTAMRFSNWSTAPIAGDRILFMPPDTDYMTTGEGYWQRPRMLDKTVALAVADDVLYATNRTGTVRAYDLLKGNLIEWLNPGPEVLGCGGFFESKNRGVRAFATGGGEHLVLRESNNTIRILAHRWKPEKCDNGALPPAPEPWANSGDGNIQLFWGGRTGITGTVKGYYVSRSSEKAGPYTKIGGLLQRPVYNEKRPNGQAAWYRVATVNLRGEGAASQPLLVCAQATTIKRIINDGTIDATGWDNTTRGNWQGVYGKEAVYLYADATKDKDADSLKRKRFANGLIVWPGLTHDAHLVDSTPENQDSLQSQLMPDKRIAGFPWRESQWGPVTFIVNLTDGQTRRMSFYLAQAENQERVQRFRFSDLDTGKLIYEEQLSWPDTKQHYSYASFAVTGRFRLDIYTVKGDSNIQAMFLDPMR